MAKPILEARNLSKTFAGNKALDSVDLDLFPGEIHALVGQNGSGKSTLIKILSAYHRPDPGAEVRIAGVPLELGNPGAVAAAGLRFVHQDLGLVPTLGALDNLALGRGYVRGRTGTISWRREAKAGARMLGELGYNFDLSRPVSGLTAAERTGIAIIRAISGEAGEARVLVLDEPTASLPAAEVERLFEVIRRVSSSGVAVIYVSHHFNEVFDICDRVTVLRDGKLAARREIDEIDEDQLIELTIGRSLAAFERAAAVEHSAASGTVLSLRRLRGQIIESLDLDLSPGEIVGVAGVTGSGREEVIELIFGSTLRAGSVVLDGRELPADRPDLSVRRGMVMVPADRAAKAALADRSVRENVTLSDLSSVYGPRGLRKEAERAASAEWLQRLEVVPQDGEVPLGTLSGGNQQKVMVARALRLDPRVLLLDEPTQGVDIGAKAGIHKIIQDAAHREAGVVVASTESEELVSLCDRILVLNRGRIAGVVNGDGMAADELTHMTLRGGRASMDPISPDSQRRSG
ncbi:MAG: ribose transport system ATP-binding protein [Solirubrobacterales bacterium]|jgi:ribose transport system ATP-binding protein|nr:ribose transport system ATP-binding protein [Solirubrobacterales bacterium]